MKINGFHFEQFPPIERNKDGSLIHLSLKDWWAVKHLIREHCCHLDPDGNCLLLDDGDACICPQLISQSLICKYLRRAVLPADPSLYADVMQVTPGKRCLLCNTPIFSTSNAAKYCPACAQKERRRRDAERKRKAGITLRK